MIPGGPVAEALERLDAITRRLRVECPWDREQDERSIVPHTVEEAYELADAAHRSDDGKLLDELGDVLFQVYFLSLLLEERGAGSLARVAEHVTEKLIRRHPHVFGDAEVADAAQVLRNWDAIKAEEPGRERGVFGEVPESLPALLYARKLQRRAASASLHPAAQPRAPREAPARALTSDTASSAQASAATSAAIEAERSSAADAERHDAECFRDIGERLFALVDEARAAKVDPELALRAAAQRFRERIESEQQPRNGER